MKVEDVIGTKPVRGRSRSKLSIKTGEEKKPSPSQKEEPEPLAFEVPIEEYEIPSRGGKSLVEEKWPFGKLEFAKRDRTGKVVGKSFFIPESENPVSALATARKRHKDSKFTGRKMQGKHPVTKEEVPGTRVWRLPAE